jgi:hypothetical protein
MVKQAMINPFTLMRSYKKSREVLKKHRRKGTLSSAIILTMQCTNTVLSAIAALLAGTAGVVGNQGGMWKQTCIAFDAFSVATAAAKVQKTEQIFLEYLSLP